MHKKSHSPKSSAKKKPKKPVAKSPNPKLLQPVPEEHVFILLGGKTLHSLPQLIFELDEMPDHVFNHHVNKEKNDFSNWIKHVIGEVELAEKLVGIDSRKDAQLVLLKHLVKSTHR
jgi:hypothetical protein